MMPIVRSYLSTRLSSVHQEKNCTVSQDVYFGLLFASPRENSLPCTEKVLHLTIKTAFYMIFVINH